VWHLRARDEEKDGRSHRVRILGHQVNGVAGSIHGQNRAVLKQRQTTTDMAILGSWLCQHYGCSCDGWLGFRELLAGRNGEERRQRSCASTSSTSWGAETAPTGS
jgi:hypothetical protein